MNKFNKKEIVIAILVTVTVMAAVFGYRHWMDKKMIAQFSFGLPEGLFDPDNRSHWKIAVNVREQELQEMEGPGYKEQEQQKMKRFGFDISVTDDMISARYMETKKELQFAQKQLKRFSE